MLNRAARSPGISAIGVRRKIDARPNVVACRNAVPQKRAPLEKHRGDSRCLWLLFLHLRRRKSRIAATVNSPEAQHPDESAFRLLDLLASLTNHLELCADTARALISEANAGKAEDPTVEAVAISVADQIARAHERCRDVLRRATSEQLPSKRPPGIGWK